MRLRDFEPVISDVTLGEIRDTPDGAKRLAIEGMVGGIAVVKLDNESLSLAEVYVGRGVFPEKYIGDAYHVAVAATNGIPYLVSWNFRHLVKLATKREVNLLNLMNGYGMIEIVTPPEL